MALFLTCFKGNKTVVILPFSLLCPSPHMDTHILSLFSVIIFLSFCSAPTNHILALSLYYNHAVIFHVVFVKVISN